MSNPIADIRTEYKQHSLDESGVPADPMQQFALWWEEAVNSGIGEVNAMTLATATKDGVPSARIVLLKGFDARGFIFYTNYHSQKGKELELNAQAALVFFWKELERQVRIEGTVEKTSREESRQYFESRPAGSRIGANVSPQSKKIAGRKELEERFEQLKTEYSDENIPLPENWGGYIIKPRLFEFWQGRPSRLHDRIQYTQTGDAWKIDRLAP